MGTGNVNTLAVKTGRYEAGSAPCGLLCSIQGDELAGVGFMERPRRP